ncbi:unnamed protein product [Polarella glacialis]|uniref:Uncharacterized protein n=1 Tax=Polarella glacialis TaxID=89957 RepID=A0A813DD45_POLGL|nr:unnamed protein product [Polarella glacialis]
MAQASLRKVNTKSSRLASSSCTKYSQRILEKILRCTPDFTASMKPQEQIARVSASWKLIVLGHDPNLFFVHAP